MRAATLVVLGGLLMASCTSPRHAVTDAPDDQFGHRYEGNPPDGHSTVTITVPTDGETYTHLPVVFETVVVRPAPIDSTNNPVPVEILVKGAMPDACTELHSFSQSRTGHLIEALLEMRRPTLAVCASVRRPFRVYLMLEGMYGPGSYTLRLNDKVVPFEIRLPEL